MRDIIIPACDLHENTCRIRLIALYSLLREDNGRARPPEIEALIDLQGRRGRRRQIGDRKSAWNQFYHRVIAHGQRRKMGGGCL